MRTAALQDGGVGDSLVPSLADPGLERVELRFPSPGGDQELVKAGGAGGPVDGLAVQAGGAADRGDRLPRPPALEDLGVMLAGAPGQPPFPPGRPASQGAGRLLGWPGFEAAAVAGDCLLRAFPQVVPQMPGVRPSYLRVQVLPFQCMVMVS
jgi:hypothetical protein